MLIVRGDDVHMIEGVVVITLGFDIDVQHLMVGIDQRGSKFGSYFDVFISLRHGECRGGRLQ